MFLACTKSFVSLVLFSAEWWPIQHWAGINCQCCAVMYYKLLVVTVLGRNHEGEDFQQNVENLQKKNVSV